MTVWEGALFGLVQGFTEFLPVSSSGHLALFRHLFHLEPSSDVGMEVTVHLGTLLAVIIFYYKQLFSMGKDILTQGKWGGQYCLLLFIGTLPAGVAGLAIQDKVETLFNHISWVGIAWVVLGSVLVVVDRFGEGRLEPVRMGWWRALGVGIAQMVAIMPGISRSGATISAALGLGVERKGAVEFSFLLSIPVIGGAVILTLWDWKEGRILLGISYLSGLITSFISGYIAIKVLLKVVSSRNLFWFGVYCLLLGIVTLLFLG
ncbi:MAG: undecaprenyl-diphosphate phosphatase [bacterium]